MVPASGMTAISRIVAIAGAASSSPSRASARSCALCRPLAPNRPATADRPVNRAVVAISPPLWGRKTRHIRGRLGAVRPDPQLLCVAVRVPLPLLDDLAHLVGHLLDRLVRFDLLRHRLAEGWLDGIGGHLRVERGHRTWLQALER